jgi:hypothetical protein
MLPGDPHQVEVPPGARLHTSAGVKLDGVMDVYGKGQGASQAPVALQIIAFHPVNRGAAAGIVGAVQRRPNPSWEIVYDVALQGKDRVLLAVMVDQEFIVLRVKAHARIRFKCPAPYRLGDSHFWFKGPAVRADIRNPGGIVLTKGRGYQKICPEDSVLSVFPKLLEG